jgi:hypothetical protein
MIAIKPKEYAELPFVEKMVTRPGDYFYNAPLVGHAVAMGPGKNVMLSIRQPTRDFVVRPELLPLLHRAVNVTRAVIHSDVRRFHRWSKLTMDHDNSLYGNRKPVSQSGLLPRASRVGKRILSAVAGRLRGR